MNKKHRMFVRMVLASLLRRRSRMIIALLAIVVGATILSGLGLIYYDVPRQMSAQFRNYGANVIFTPSGSSEMNQTEIEKAVAVFPSDKLEGYTPYRYENTKLNNLPEVRTGIFRESCLMQTERLLSEKRLLRNSD